MPRSSDRRTAGAEEVADALIAEGNRAEHAGKLQRARQLYERAVEAAPDYAKAHLNLGTALEAEDRAQAASVAYERAFALDPRDPYVCYNLGKAVRRTDPARADELLRAALAAKAPFPEALVVLAEVSESQGRPDDALAALREALRQRPDYAGAWHNCGLLLQRLERFDEAEDALRSAIAFDPGLLASRHSLAILLRQEGRVVEAATTLAAARQLAPDDFHLESTQIHTLAYLDTVAPEELFRRHRDFGARLEAIHHERFRPFTNMPDPGRKLRIGYVSSDFNLHPVSLFMLPLLENHDRAAYRVHGYSTGARHDAVTVQIRERCDEWLDAAELTDEALADAVHRDRVDVLIDLTGHAGPMRLALFAQRPAPVAASWLGYLGTTGLKRIGYRISDAYADPEGLAEAQHTESIVRLPHSQWCYRPVLDREHASEPPRARNGLVTFGSFNHASKVSSSVRSLWARILARVPRSRLLVAGVPEGRARAAMAAEFRDARLAADRVQFAPRVAMDRYFQLYDEVDIALDTTPYGGGATTCDALWMGVPVVTLAGSRSVSRSAASILTTLGLERWIARTPDEYVEIATAAADDRSGVAEARVSLRERMRGSPLTDGRSFARGFEDACRRMWRAWCADASRESAT